MLTTAHAEQIAALLNERNELTVKYTGQRVLDSAANYLCRHSEGGEVIACIEVKQVQWYQAELLHLTVAATFERKGHAQALVCAAESMARRKSVRVLQCTVRESNTASLELFKRSGFKQVNAFFNENSGNTILVLQKVLTSLPPC